MNFETIARRAGGALLAFGLLAAGGGCTTGNTSSAQIDPAARAEIDRMRAAMNGLERYRMTVESLTDETLPSGRRVQVGRTTEIKVARPDRLAVTVVRDSGQRWSAWLAGGRFLLLDESAKQYASLDVPAGIDAGLEDLGDRLGLQLPLADVVSALRREDLLTRARVGLFVGTETVAGRACTHVLFRQPVADWQAWIDAGEPALLRRMLMTYKDEPGNPAYQATVTAWDVAPQFDDATWRPRLPADAREVPMKDLLDQE